MFDINFIAYAINSKRRNVNYEDFLIPYTFFCLLFNTNSHVEIIVLDPDEFNKKYSKEIDSIKKINSNFLIRKPQYELNRHINNTYRFFEVPTIESKYTYICDIDIMILEELLPKYLNTWPKKLPYHNIIRKNTNRLTGVIMVKTDEYYTDSFKKSQQKYYNIDYNHNSDEITLYKMCNDSHGLPDTTFKYRPVLGIHFSPNRGINKRLSLCTYKHYYNTFLDVSKKYQHLFEYNIFSNLLNKLNNEFNIGR